MDKNILILSDFVGYGNVALHSARTILTKMGCQVFALPTAVISNTWNYGRAVTLDTTDFLFSSLEAWESMGFRFDAVLIGYISGERQAAEIARLCPKWRAQGAEVFLDPILADNGKLYNGVTPQQIDHMRLLAGQVDWVLPNVTEAQYLARCEVCGSLSREAAEELAAALASGGGNVVITGAEVDGRSCVALWDGQLQLLPYEAVPGRFSGTGDAFSAVFAGSRMQGLSPADSARAAMEKTKEWIIRSRAEDWKGTGLPIERYF